MEMQNSHLLHNDHQHSSTPKSYLSQSQCSLSQSSFFMEDDHWYSELVLKMPDAPGFLSRSGGGERGRVKRSSTFNSDEDCILGIQTPSPADSGIVELEAMLREKDSEISYLRETLEQNEQVCPLALFLALFLSSS